MYSKSDITFALTLGALCGQSLGFWPFSAFASASSDTDTIVKRVAIIGAGAGGASTSFHLQKFAALSGTAVDITVYEKSSFVGGRSTTVDAYDDPTQPVELGASIFVEVNEILKNATELFGLPRASRNNDDDNYLGIWNGKEFVYTQKGGGWWNAAKLLWKYGLAPIRTQNLMKKTVGKFRQLYTPPFFPFRSLSDRAFDLGLTDTTSITGEQLLEANNIGAPFSTDIIQASTRVNYGSNLATIHGLETMVCMAIEGAMSVEGGNWQIFNSMLKASNATVNLNTTVTSIKKSKGKYILAVSDTNEHPASLSERSSSFDTVVLAAPFQFSNIELEVDLVKKTPDKIPYVQLHVTLFTSTEKLSPRFFGLQADKIVPDSILTTLPPGTEAPSDPTKGVGPTGFFSISTLRTLVNPKTLQKEYLYKIFSPKKVTAAFLFDLLGTDALPEDLSMISQESGHAVSWYYPKVWYSYPYELPRVTFEELELAQGFYYTSGIESFISTMETSALMGMNIAQLIVDDYLQVQDVKADASEKGSQVVLSEKMVDEL